MLLASLVTVVEDVGIPALFVFIAVETMGIPLPGETALVAMAILASQGHFPIEWVLVAAAAGAIVGDNVGFFLGRRYGRRVLASERGPFHRHRLKLLELGEPFFERHGPKAVFVGRWIAGLRITAAWLAGSARMSWPVFTLYNALGGICWALSVGLLAYYLGHTAETIFRTVGLVGLAAFALVVLVIYAIARRRAHGGG
ncbi:MAG: DedA family protein [Solirubrobacteraceae bacterium]|nr:DedA family protein [Solirubrobacteraceae bacterium]